MACPFYPHEPTSSHDSDMSVWCQKATSRSLFEDDGETVLRAVVKNLVILLPNEERSACDPFGGLRETHLRWVPVMIGRQEKAGHWLNRQNARSIWHLSSSASTRLKPNLSKLQKSATAR